MKSLLFLVHRIPYPPNKGDKITTCNMLRYFARHFRVFLGSFVDDPGDWQYAGQVRNLCAETCLLPLNPRLSRLRSLGGLLTGEALSVAYYRSRKMQEWVNKILARENIDAVLVYSGAMARFVPERLPENTHTILDLDDVDSEKWRSYAETHRWPVSLIYRREAEKLLAYERRMAARFEHCLFISAEEADLFARLAPEVRDRLQHRTQGVDSDYFDPGLCFDNPFEPHEQAIVFTGAMDYWPNIDAVIWFAREIFPRVQTAVASARFYIVGMNPAETVTALAENPGITVTGSVPDVRPYLSHAAAVIAPLRIARGIQNKVLEAMSMAKPVLATPEAMTGIIPCPQAKLFISNNANKLTDAAIELLSGTPQADQAARDCILRNYNWDANLSRIADLLRGDHSSI